MRRSKISNNNVNTINLVVSEWTCSGRSGRFEVIDAGRTGRFTYMDFFEDFRYFVVMSTFVIFRTPIVDHSEEEEEASSTSSFEDLAPEVEVEWDMWRHLNQTTLFLLWEELSHFFAFFFQENSRYLFAGGMIWLLNSKC